MESNGISIDIAKPNGSESRGGDLESEIVLVLVRSQHGLGATTILFYQLNNCREMADAQSPTPGAIAAGENGVCESAGINRLGVEKERG
jgi:hypothetical protein